MLYRLTNPEDSDKITGYVWRNGTPVEIEAGHSFTTDNLELANDVKRTFPNLVLEIFEEDEVPQEVVSEKPREEETSKKNSSEEEDSYGALDFLSLRKIAKSKGINVVGLKKEELLNELKGVK